MWIGCLNTISMINHYKISLYDIISLVTICKSKEG